MIGQLLVEAEGKEKKIFSFEEEENKWTLGSDPASPFYLQDPSVSSQHVLFSSVDGALMAQNLSSGQTLLNGEPLIAPTPLKEGDVLKVGDFTATLTLQGQSQPVTEETDLPATPSPEELSQEENEDEGQEVAVSARESVFEETAPAGVGGTPEVHFDLLNGARFLLKVVGGPNSGAEFPLSTDQSYVIGTDPQVADIVFHDVSVSRQHASVVLKPDNRLLLKDLGSRNGTYLDEDKVEQEVELPPNKVVTLGTSTFVVLDTEGERNTIISPLLPSIVKVLQKQEERKAAQVPAEEEKEVKKEPQAPSFSLLGAFILVAVMSTLLAIVGLGVRSLLTTHEVPVEKVDVQKDLQRILAATPSVRYSYTDTTGRLLLVGHVLTSVERSELMLAIQNIPAIRSVEDNIIVDEFVWKEANQILAQNPEWRGVSMISPSPGIFQVTGVVASRRQLDTLVEYLNQTFNFPELLDFKVVVEEDLLNQVNALVRNRGFTNVKAAYSEGQIRLTGVITVEQEPKFQAAVEEIGKIPGVRAVQNLVVSHKTEAIANISSRYKVSGFLDQGGGKSSVVINGRIVGVGDVLDGMTITSITQEAIYLERDGEKFRIDNSR